MRFPWHFVSCIISFFHFSFVFEKLNNQNYTFLLFLSFRTNLHFRFPAILVLTENEFNFRTAVFVLFYFVFDSTR